MNYKIAIIGTKFITEWFKFLGCEEHIVHTKEEAKEKLFELKKSQKMEDNKESTKKYAIIFVIEELIKDISVDDYKKLSSGMLPVIVPIPSNKGSTGFGKTRIKNILNNAVKINIF